MVSATPPMDRWTSSAWWPTWLSRGLAAAPVFQADPSPATSVPFFYFENCPLYPLLVFKFNYRK